MTQYKNQSFFQPIQPCWKFSVRLALDQPHNSNPQLPRSQKQQRPSSPRVWGVKELVYTSATRVVMVASKMDVIWEVRKQCRRTRRETVGPGVPVRLDNVIVIVLNAFGQRQSGEEGEEEEKEYGAPHGSVMSVVVWNMASMVLMKCSGYCLLSRTPAAMKKRRQNMK
jgi:hypothetical protein